MLLINSITMNPFYKLRTSYNKSQDIEEYYNNRRYFVLLNLLFNQTDTVDDEFQKRVTGSAVKSYFNVCNQSDLVKEFETNMSKGRAEYVADQRNPKLSQEEKDMSYTQFWSWNGNQSVLDKYQRSDTKDLLFNPTKLEKYLRSKKTNTTTPYIMRIKPDYKNVPIKDSIKIVEDIAHIIIIKSFSFLCLFLMLLNWITWLLSKLRICNHMNKKLSCYNIYSLHHKQKIGYFYYLHDYVGQPMTHPLGLGYSLVMAPATHQTTHEIIHTVQNSFTPFYMYPKELVEIVPMYVENLLTNTESRSNPLIGDFKLSEFGELYRNRNISLAIADLKANTSSEFDEIFNKEMGCNFIHISNRTPMYMHYDRKYYSYALGLIVDIPIWQLQILIKSPHECLKFIEKLLDTDNRKLLSN